MSWLLSISCLDDSDTSKTLRFSEIGFIDASENYLRPNLVQPSLINVSPNDGGTFKIFDEDSIGEIELNNTDSELAYLADYALNGRSCVLSFADGGVITEYFSGTIDRVSWRGDAVFLSLKALSDSLTDNLPLSVYDSTAVGAWTDEGIDGDVIPKAYGAESNITAKLVSESLLIYQVSSRSDCRITAVYFDGLRDINYQTDGAVSAGATSIDVDSGVGGIPTGSKIAVGSPIASIYIVQTGFSNAVSGTVTLTSPLLYDVPNNTPVDIVNSFTGTGTGTGQLRDAAFDVATWSSYNGYLRLADNPANAVITVDVITVDGSNAARLAFDVFADVAGDLDTPITVDTTNQTAINALGNLGLFVDGPRSVADCLDAIVRSIGGYYYFVGDVLFVNLLDVPATPSFVIDDNQITDLQCDQNGLGDNGVPIKGFQINYDRIETVQTTVAGAVSKSRKERLGNQWRKREVITSAVATRHLLSQTKIIDSLLRSKTAVNLVIARLNNVSNPRRDVATLQIEFIDPPSFAMGDTFTVQSDFYYDYSAGRDFVIIGYELNAQDKTLKLRIFG